MISALIQVATNANLDDEIRSCLKVDDGGEKEEAGEKSRSWTKKSCTRTWLARLQGFAECRVPGAAPRKMLHSLPLPNPRSYLRVGCTCTPDVVPQSALRVACPSID